MTLFENPITPKDVRYNHVYAHTHAVIERTIGLLKGRWMCLDTTGGKLLYTPEKVCSMLWPSQHCNGSWHSSNTWNMTHNPIWDLPAGLQLSLAMT